MLDKLVTIPVGQVSNIAKWAATAAFNELPSINAFAVTGMQPIRWRDKETAFTPTGGALEGALVIWGTAGRPA